MISRSSGGASSRADIFVTVKSHHGKRASEFRERRRRGKNAEKEGAEPQRAWIKLCYIFIEPEEDGEGNQKEDLSIRSKDAVMIHMGEIPPFSVQNLPNYLIVSRREVEGLS